MMNKKDFNKVIDEIIIIKGEKLKQLSRAGSMIGLGFGDDVKTKTVVRNDDGKLEVKETLSAKYAIDVDGFFRIINQGKILLAKDDMFRPNSQIQNDDFDEADFEWDAEGNNKFDEHKGFIEAMDLIVEDVVINELGDLKIILSNKFSIEVFVDTNEDEECWRFFEVGNTEKPHIVITGCGYYEK